MRLSLFVAALIFSSVGFAQFSGMQLSEVAVMQLRADGKYDVICKNGTREVDAELDVRLNNLCPNQTSSAPTNMLSVQIRADGQFDVLCRDLTKHIVTEADLMAGKACAGAPIPGVVLTAGLYDAVEGHTSYYAQNITPVVKEGILVGVDVRATSSWAVSLICETQAGVTVCKGPNANSTYWLTVLDANSYRFGYGADEANLRDVAIFKRH